MTPTNEPDVGQQNSISAEVGAVVSDAIKVDLMFDERGLAQFMQTYFTALSKLILQQEEHALAFQSSFFSDAYLRKLQERWRKDRAHLNAHPARILSIENHGETAVVVAARTYQCDGSDEELSRYHLRKIDSGWEIDRKGELCFSCKDSGEGDDETCTQCAGVGWLYYGASKKEKSQ